MAVRAEDLTLVATVQAEAADLATVTAGVLERLIAVASDAIRQYIGRSLHRATLTETFPARCGVLLPLERRPVVSVTSVSYNSVAYVADGTDYEIHDAAAGLLYRRAGWPFSGNFLPGLLQEDRNPGTEQKLLSVVYVGGWITPAQNGTGSPALVRDLPYDLEQACIETVVDLYRRKGRAGDIATESIGVASVSYRNPNVITGLGSGGIIPDTVLPILNSYRSLR